MWGHNWDKSHALREAVALHEDEVTVRGNVPNWWVISFKLYKSRRNILRNVKYTIVICVPRLEIQIGHLIFIY